MLLVLFGVASCQQSSHPPKGSDQKVNEWFDSGEYLNGLKLIPDPSIDRRSFAQHYLDHREIWDKTFAYLKETDFTSITPGRVELGDHVFATVSEYVPRDREEAIFEAHKKYIDVQYVISGHELMDIAPLENMTVTKQYDAENDVELGSVIKFLELAASSERFFIFFPTDAHRPGLKAEDDNALVRKVVIKVPVTF